MDGSIPEKVKTKLQVDVQLQLVHVDVKPKDPLENPAKFHCCKIVCQRGSTLQKTTKYEASWLDSYHRC